MAGSVSARPSKSARSALVFAFGLLDAFTIGVAELYAVLAAGDHFAPLAGVPTKAVVCQDSNEAGLGCRCSLGGKCDGSPERLV
jgi:hypothetical protein